MGTVLMVAAAIAFGLLGPRMGQRGMRVRGIPATALRDAVLDVVLGGPAGSGLGDIVHASDLGSRDPQAIRDAAMGDLAEVLGPAVEPPVLEAVGFDLAGSTRLELMGVPAARLDYRSAETGRNAILFELADPLAFVHFDDRGRQQPLLPGTRIQETVRLGPPGGGGIVPSIGLVIVAVEGRATVVVALDPAVAAEIVDALDPRADPESDAVPEAVATILGKPIGPMSRF